MVTMTKDKQILEGVGLTPDIEVDFDVTLYRSTGRDTQLDRALQYLRTGN
jgi:C-terminal processing protease CtpA/Prc